MTRLFSGTTFPLRAFLGVVLVFALLVPVAAGAADAAVNSAQTPEVQHALAPTGTLRVALQTANPLNVVQDPESGEMTGVGLDLGEELAHRLGVPFETVPYPSVGALLDGG